MICNEYGTASFKGIEFEVLPVSMNMGRRIVTSEYPFIDEHYNEDLGDKAVTWSVTGCFHGEDFRTKFWLAKRVWLVEGDGVFFEPTTNRSYAVRLKDFKVKLDQNKLNYIEFTLDLVEMANDPYPNNHATLTGTINGTIDDYIKKASQAHAEVVQIIGSII